MQLVCQTNTVTSENSPRQGSADTGVLTSGSSGFLLIVMISRGAGRRDRESEQSWNRAGSRSDSEGPVVVTGSRSRLGAEQGFDVTLACITESQTSDSCLEASLMPSTGRTAKLSRWAFITSSMLGSRIRDLISVNSS